MTEINLHYVTMLLSGLNLFMLLWMFSRYLKFRSKGIPALNYCLLLLLVGVVFGLVATASLLLPVGPLLDSCGLVLVASSLVVNSFFALMVFNLSYGEGTWIYRHHRIFVWILIGLIPLYATNSWHHLIVKEVVKDADGFGFGIVYGPASIVISVYAYLLTAMAVISIFRTKEGGMMQKRWIRLAAFGSTLIQALAALLEQIFPLLKALQLSMFITSIPVSIICYLFFGFLLTGREIALDIVDDAYVAFDLNNFCVDVNKKGVDFFRRFCNTSYPTINDVLKLLKIDNLATYTGGEICLSENGENSYYRISTFQLSSGLNQHCGNGYIIREITEFVSRMEEINAIAVQDALTGAKNRRYLDGAAPSTLQSAYSVGQPVTVMMLDIDHFKNVNDTYGHTVGDEVLIELQNILQSSLREKDTVVRYGGEEFLALCEGLNYEQGWQIAERIRENIEHTVFKTSAGDLSITVSIGVYSDLPGESDNINVYIENADEKLYEAKNGGRNRVC